MVLRSVIILGASEGLRQTIWRCAAERSAKHIMSRICQTHFGNFPAPEFDTLPLVDINYIHNILRKNKVSTLLLPHPSDAHQDHRISFKAAMIAARPVAPIYINNVLCYRSCRQQVGVLSFRKSVQPHWFVNISETISLKVSAMELFKSATGNPHPRTKQGILSLAQYRGNNVGFEYAEAFQVIRMLSN